MKSRKSTSTLIALSSVYIRDVCVEDDPDEYLTPTLRAGGEEGRDTNTTQTSSVLATTTKMDVHRREPRDLRDVDYLDAVGNGCALLVLIVFYPNPPGPGARDEDQDN